MKKQTLRLSVKNNSKLPSNKGNKGFRILFCSIFRGIYYYFVPLLIKFDSVD